MSALLFVGIMLGSWLASIAAAVAALYLSDRLIAWWYRDDA